MRRLLRPYVIALGTTVALLAGCGVLAFASWINNSDSEIFTVYAAKLPPVARPNAILRVMPIVRWKPAPAQPKLPIHTYVVTRHLGTVDKIVCTVPGTVRWRYCLDRDAPAGGIVTYTVAATNGTYWVSKPSERSGPVTMPGIPSPETVRAMAGASLPPSTDPSGAVAPSASGPVLGAGEAVRPSGEPTPTSTATVYIPPPKPPGPPLPSDDEEDGSSAEPTPSGESTDEDGGAPGLPPDLPPLPPALDFPTK